MLITYVNIVMIDFIQEFIIKIKIVKIIDLKI